MTTDLCCITFQNEDMWLGTGVEDGSNNWKWKVCFNLYLVSVNAEKNV